MSVKIKEEVGVKGGLEEDMLICNVCGKCFKERYKYNRHVQCHTKNFKCSLCGRSFACRHSLEMHTLIHTGEKPHKCSYCGKNFRCSYNRDKHEVVHTGEKNYKCDMCGKSYTEKGTLQKHKKNVHGAEPRHPCPICHKRFNWKETVERHIKRTHSLHPETFDCKACDKKYATKQSLSSHLDRIHLGVKRVKCKTCGELFGNSNQLYVHKKNYHNDTYYGCSTCNKKFIMKCYLASHIMKVHLNMKPYTCQYCGQQFKYQGQYQQHELAHVKPRSRDFVCDFCQKCYFLKEQVIRHIVSKHL